MSVIKDSLFKGLISPYTHNIVTSRLAILPFHTFSTHNQRYTHTNSISHQYKYPFKIHTKANYSFSTPQNRQLHTYRPLFSKHLQTRESLLSQANNFWERFVIRSKWFLIKSYRPFNVDEITAFFSWIILSHLLWIVLGTTTFFSLLFYGLNSLFAKELVGRLTGNFITWLSPGFDIKFQDAVVPEWKDGMIDFKKVIVKTVENDDDKSRIKLDLKLDSIKLTLSFKKWKNLKGLIENVEINGMSGVIDKRSIDRNSPEVDWFSNKDYELGVVKVKDSELEILQDDSDPMKISIYNCEIPRLRKSWIFLDFWNAASITGSINDSLFTIHKRQHKFAYVNDVEEDLNPWKRITRFKLDPVDIKTIGLSSPQFNWLVDGKVDLTADIMPPAVDQDSQLPYSSRYVVVDFKLQFNDVKTRLPHELPTLSTGEPIVSFDQLKTIVSYFNNKRAESSQHHDMNNNLAGFSLAPISFRIVKKLSDLENVSTLRESNLLDLISTEIYIDLMKHVQEYEVEQRNKKLALWGKTVASQLLVVGLGAMA